MRTHYRNGDEIGLKECGCDGCSPLGIDGVFCHESGCPDSWRDYPESCFECGCEFFRTEGRHQKTCPDCQRDLENPEQPEEDDHEEVD